jgi:hypothetical protein
LRVAEAPKLLPSQRGETWNDTETINRHRLMTPSEHVAKAIEVSRAALRFAHAKRAPDDRDSPAHADLTDHTGAKPLGAQDRSK